MHLDQATAIKHARQYAVLVSQQVNPLKIILFGSYANGNWNKNSDIDIAVIIDRIDDNYLVISKQLNKLTNNIDNRIEPVLMQMGSDQSGFLSSIMQNGMVLFEK